jgi:hypothetical protein
MRVREALAVAAARLEEVSDTPRLDAELLMAHALDASREQMLLQGLEEEAPSLFAALVERRLAHEPVAYITGRRAFWTIELTVGRGVLIPRPDTETLIEAAVEHFGDRGPVLSCWLRYPIGRKLMGSALMRPTGLLNMPKIMHSTSAWRNAHASSSATGRMTCGGNGI